LRPEGNPYLRAWRLRRRNRARTESLAERLWSGALPLLATLVLVPLVRPVFLSFLEQPKSTWADGMAGIVLRAGIAIIGVLSIDLYGALVRGEDRKVLAGLPVDPAQVVAYEVIRVTGERWWLLPASALLLAPVAYAGAVALWAWGVVALVGCWVLAVAVSSAVHLLAIDVAENPKWAPTLDLIRGHNPRPQAAFIYAPGVVLLVAGLIVSQAASGAAAVAQGEWSGLVWLVLPWPLAAFAASRVPALARANWFQGSAILAEIDARYAALDSREDAAAVYLDWTVRFAPARVSLYALKDLRHGWRGRRSLITGAWLIGVGALAAGWTGAAVGPSRAAVVSVAGVWLVSALGVLLESDEPEFLRVWLREPSSARWVARVLVLLAWVQPCIWLAVAAVTMRRGLVDGATVLAVGIGAAVVAIPVAMGFGAMRRRGLFGYAAVGTVLAAAWMALTTGWMT